MGALLEAYVQFGDGKPFFSLVQSPCQGEN
jgi:hypothetical protein